MNPILYSFRRCPYAIRARLAIASADVNVELREIVLREKPAAFLEASASATVPCLVAQVQTNGEAIDQTNGETIDESLDIMKWALAKHDPEGWLSMPHQGWAWIARADGPFKDALDRTKYETRYPNTIPGEQRALAAVFLADLNTQIDVWMFDRPTIADYAILPFVRQFAFIDKDWFDAQPWPNLQRWLENFLVSKRFLDVMEKHPKWEEGDTPLTFPQPAPSAPSIRQSA